MGTIMDKVSQAMFPIHQRRMEVFDCKQKSDSKRYLRELMDKVKMAEWKTFNQQAAVCHLFMQGCKSEEASKACFKNLKRRGHLKVDCWGKCSFCGRFGHKAEVCRDKLKADQKDALKKADYKKTKERKKEKMKMKKKTK